MRVKLPLIAWRYFRWNVIHMTRFGILTMLELTLRKEFISGFVALLVLTGMLGFASVQAVNSLNAELGRVVHRMWAQADRTSQMVGPLSELAGCQ